MSGSGRGENYNEKKKRPLPVATARWQSQAKGIKLTVENKERNQLINNIYERGRGKDNDRFQWQPPDGDLETTAQSSRYLYDTFSKINKDITGAG